MGNYLVAQKLLIDKVWRSFSGRLSTTTSIMDIPYVFWARFLEVCSSQENALLNLCLSSPNMDLAITEDSTKMKMRLRGEKVFSILVLNYYINEEELLRCARSNCEDLARFALSSNWCVELLSSNRFWRESITFSNFQEINQFHEKAKEAESKWELFRNKQLVFDRRTTTAEEKSMFWMAATHLMKTFGAYIVELKINDEFYLYREELQNLCTDLTAIMPRLRYLTCNYDVVTNQYMCMVSKCDKRSMEPVRKMIGFPSTFVYTKWYNVLVNSCKRSTIKVEELGLPEHGQVQQLVICIPDRSSPYQKLLNADLSDFRNLTNLTLYGHNNIMVSIRLLRKLPNVNVLGLLNFGWELGFSEVYSMIRDSGTRFPFVKKLALGLSNPPFQLDVFASLFPSLRHLQLEKRCNHNQDTLHTLLADWNDLEGDLNNGEVDVYQLYAQKLSLKDSNIWNYMKNLNVLCIQTSKEVEVGNDDTAGVGPSNKRLERQEIYTRLENGLIQMEDLILPYSHYWLE